MMTDLNGKVVLVTGAGRGQGRSLALKLAAQGAILALNDVSPLNVDDVAGQIIASGGQAHVYLHDVAKKVAAQSLVNQVLDAHGRIDILVNHANVQPSAGLLAMDEWDLHRVFEVNTIGVFLMMQSVGRVMREQGSGLMINLLGDIDALPSAAGFASQWAVAGLTRKTAAELSAVQIRVYALARGWAAPDVFFSSADEAVLALCGSQQIPTGSILGLSA